MENQEKINKIQDVIKGMSDELDWKFHIQPVINNAKLLANYLNANKEIVELGALLHDVGRLKFGPNKHDITGVLEAKKILNKFNYSKKFIQEVVHCVKTHRAKSDNTPQSLEAKIVANADAMAHFDAMPYFFYRKAKETNFNEILNWVEQKIKKDWETKLTLDKAKKIVNEKYKAIIIILDSLKKLT